LNTKYNNILGALIIFIGAICFSSKAILVKLAYNYHIDAVSLLTLRMVLSFPFFAGVLAFSVRKDTSAPIEKKDWFYLIILGILGYYLSSYFDFKGLEFITAGLERLILFIYPTLVVLLSAVLYKKKIKRTEILALLLTYSGIAVVFLNDLQFDQSNVTIGGLLIFGSAFTYAFYLIGSGKLIPKIGAVRYNSISMMVSTLIVVVHYFINAEGNLLHYDWQVYALSLVMALVATVIPSFLLAEGIRLIGAGKAAIIGSVGPVSTIILAYIFLNEDITLLQLTGTAFVLAGVLLVSKSK
jgi:drug/metabolite transporter (DMT)-like permease